jgi:hypothetical protein
MKIKVKTRSDWTSQNKCSWSAAVVFLSLFSLAAVKAQAADTNQLTPEFMQKVLDRLAQDEAEIKGLKEALTNRPAAVAPSSGAANTASDVQWQQRVQKDEADLKDLQSELNARDAADTKPKYPNLQFHGFGDIDFAADSRKSSATPTASGVTAIGGKNTFYEGELDLFTTAQLAQNISFTMEPVLSAGFNNYMGLDLERYYLEYRGNEYFNVDAGRVHTSLGYYSTTYHHGTWLQTAIGRPTVIQFEDSGGILPIHMTGVSLYGAIPSGRLNLNYRLEIGNGLDFSSNPNNNPVQQVVSFSDSKAVNVAVSSRPEGLPGAQFGGGVYFDSITPDLATMPVAGEPHSLPSENQYIPNAYFVFHNGDWEFLNEFYLIRDDPIGASAHDNPAFFTQISHKFGVWTPYARFNYYDISSGDLLYKYAWAGGVNSGIHYGPSLGLRYDFADYAALKAQYDWLHDSGMNNASRITLQLCFTF